MCESLNGGDVGMELDMAYELLSHRCDWQKQLNVGMLIALEGPVH